MPTPFEAQNPTAAVLSFHTCSRLGECSQITKASETEKEEQVTSFGKDYRCRVGGSGAKEQKVPYKFHYRAWGDVCFSARPEPGTLPHETVVHPLLRSTIL